MNKVYIDVCDNFRFFLRLNHKKLSNKFFQRKILLLQFLFFTNFQIISKINYRRKRIIIIYMKKNKDKIHICNKINKLLIHEYNNKVVLSNKILEAIKDSKYDSIQDYFRDVRENKNNFSKEIVNVIDFVLKKRNQRMEENNIYILSAAYNVMNYDNIINLVQNCKSINFVTPDIKEYHALEEKIYNSIGVQITVSNNKRKSLANAQYIINIDFTEDIIRKYNLYRNATIFNISPFSLLNIKGFEGVIINGVTFEEKDKSFSRMIDRRFDEIYDKNYEITDLIGNNGSIHKMY